MTDKLEYSYFDLKQLQDSCAKLISGDWGLEDDKKQNKKKDDNKSILPVLEFKLSILHKMASNNLESYEEQRLNILKEYVKLNEDGNLKQKEIDQKELKNKTFYDVLEWKTDNSRSMAETEIAKVLKEKINISKPLDIKVSEFVNKNGEPLSLNGVGYGLTDFIKFED